MKTKKSHCSAMEVENKRKVFLPLAASSGFAAPSALPAMVAVAKAIA